MIVRTLVLFFFFLMFVMTFTSRGDEWLVAFRIFQCSIETDALDWILIVSLISFISLLVISVAFLVRELSEFWHSRNVRSLVHLTVF